MTKEQFIKEISKIQTAYKKPLNQNELKLWFGTFEKMDLNVFKNAIDKTIKESKFMPKIADVVSKIESNAATDPYAYLYKNNEWCELIKE